MEARTRRSPFATSPSKALYADAEAFRLPVQTMVVGPEHTPPTLFQRSLGAVMQWQETALSELRILDNQTI